jgi:ANTAR domain-containing protein/GAF domain-containing protein
VLDDVALPPATRLAMLARELCERSDEAEARQLLVNEAVVLCGCAAAAFARTMPSGALDLTWGGPTELVEQLARILQPIGEAAATATLAERQPVVSPDLAAEDRWPRYTTVLLQHSPIRSVQAHPVRLAGSELGALVLYAEGAGFFVTDQSQPGALLADHAAIGLSLLQSRHKTEHLTIALQNSREIGQAMGILMSSRKITADAAFDLLRDASQRGHVKLREVAKEVVLTGQLPTPTETG